MPEKIKIPVAGSFAEYVGIFAHPAVEILSVNRTPLIQAIVDALIPWNFDFNNLEARNLGTPSEQGLAFRLPEWRISFFIGALGCRFTKENAAWDSREEIIKILVVLLQVIFNNTTAKLKTQRLSLGMHFQPGIKHRNDILKNLISPLLPSLDAADPIALTAGVKWKNKEVFIENSTYYANGIFVKWARDFEDNVNLEHIAQQLREDQLSICKFLDVEEEL